MKNRCYKPINTNITLHTRLFLKAFLKAALFTIIGFIKIDYLFTIMGAIYQVMIKNNELKTPSIGLLAASACHVVVSNSLEFVFVKEVF